MRKDIIHKFFEGRRWRNGETIKTRGKLDPKKDYEEEFYEIHQAKSPAEYLGYDYLDGGITTNWKFLNKLLGKYVGKSWDEFYSEFTKVVPPNSFNGNEVRYAINSIKEHPLYNYYVDTEGVICSSVKEKYNRYKYPVTKIHYEDDWYFKLLVSPDKHSPCGCASEYIRNNLHEKYGIIVLPNNKCKHGNTYNFIKEWFLVKFKTVHNITSTIEFGCVVYKKKKYEIITEKKSLNKQQKKHLKNILSERNLDYDATIRS